MSIEQMQLCISSPNNQLAPTMGGCVPPYPDSVHVCCRACGPPIYSPMPCVGVREEFLSTLYARVSCIFGKFLNK